MGLDKFHQLIPTIATPSPLSTFQQLDTGECL